jgi:hypothetical protein
MTARINQEPSPGEHPHCQRVIPARFGPPEVPLDRENFDNAATAGRGNCDDDAPRCRAVFPEAIDRGKIQEKLT